MIKKLTDFIKCYENILSVKLCQDIIKNHDCIVRAQVGEGSLSNKRKCYEEPLGKKFDKDIFKAVGTILDKYSKDHASFRTGLNTEDTGYLVLKYKGTEKGEYKEHVDHYDLQPRVLSCSFILNDNYDGGNFSFLRGEHTIKKKTGSAVVFPSNFCFPHAVTPVSNGDRYAIVTWIH